jgi:hypothetical protein
VSLDRRSWLSLFVLLTATLAALQSPLSPARAATVVVVNPEADASVVETDPTSSMGASESLDSDRSPLREAYLRFAVPTLEGTVRRATLRLFVTNGTGKAPSAHATSAEWDESSLNWDNRPVAGPAVAKRGKLKKGTWTQYDVTSAVVGEGPLALVLLPRTNDGAGFASREAVAGRQPQLVVETADFDPVTTEPSTTDTSTTDTSTTDTSTTDTSTTDTSTTDTSTTTTTTVPGSCSPSWNTVRQVARMPQGESETSGFVASPAHPGWGWAIRDSGRPASLYALRLDGDQITSHEFPVVGASNYDWEDVAYTTGSDGTGVLWILENVGNGWTGSRTVYQVAEPDPLVPAPVTPVATYQIAYPDTQANSEVLFAFANDLVLISKTNPSRVYRFAGPLQPDILNVPVLVGSLSDGKYLSVATVSPDQQFLAVASHGRLVVFRNRGDLSDLAALIADPPVHNQSMVNDGREGGSFYPYGSCDLLLIAESKNVWKVTNG